MKQSIKRVIFPLSLICADIWNLLCLFQVIAFHRWGFSFAIAGIGSLTVLIPQLMSITKRHTKSPDPAPAASGKLLAGILIGPLAVLIITWIACLVYPL